MRKLSVYKPKLFLSLNVSSDITETVQLCWTLSDYGGTLSNEKKNIGVKVPVELYETVKEYADAIGVSMSDVIREAIKEKCHKVKQPSNEVEQSSNNIPP